MEKKENVIVNKTIQFSFAIIDYVELLEERKKYIILNGTWWICLAMDSQK